MIIDIRKEILDLISKKNPISIEEVVSYVSSDSSKKVSMWYQAISDNINSGYVKMNGEMLAFNSEGVKYLQDPNRGMILPEVSVCENPSPDFSVWYKAHKPRYLISDDSISNTRRAEVLSEILGRFENLNKREPSNCYAYNIRSQQEDVCNIYQINGKRLMIIIKKACDEVQRGAIFRMICAYMPDIILSEYHENYLQEHYKLHNTQINTDGADGVLKQMTDLIYLPTIEGTDLLKNI